MIFTYKHTLGICLFLMFAFMNVMGAEHCAEEKCPLPFCAKGRSMLDRKQIMKMPLRDIVERYFAGRVYLGVANQAQNIVDRDTMATRIADCEFGYVTPNNDFKQSYIHPSLDKWCWTLPDLYLNHAKQYGQILRIHGPISPQCSRWAKEDNRTAEELSRMLDEFMVALCKRYGEEENVVWMDVINETVIPNFIRDSVWGNQEAGDWFGPRDGSSQWENPWPIMGYDESTDFRVPIYIDRAFELSNKYAPKLKQIINQHDHAGQFDGATWTRIKRLVEYLREKGRRVDGIGWQAHIETGWEAIEGNVEQLDRFITWCHEHELEFHITEMNVWMKNEQTITEEQQAETFSTVFDTVVKHYKKGVVGINFWGVCDRNNNRPHWKGCLWRNDGTPRPAYMRIKEILIKHIDQYKTY